MERYTAADAFVEVLTAWSIDNIFFNPGVDTVPVQLAVNRLHTANRKVPRLVLCLDEAVAMSAAHGHYMVSGQPQLVMVHSELGTMQVGGAMHNAQWGRVPVILWAGMLQPPRRETWMKQPYDQGSIVRNCVKMERQMAADEDIRDVLGEAFQAALAEPRGPVYLSYPLDALSRETGQRAVSPIIPDSAPLSTSDDTILGEIAGILVEAANPLVLTGYAGRYEESVRALVELAETLGAAVMSGPTRVNFPGDHPLSAGFEQAGRQTGNPFKENVDVLLVIDYDTAYVSGDGPAGPETKIIHIDIAPLTQGRLLWNREADIYLQADSRKAIPGLTEKIRTALTPERKERQKERLLRLESLHDRQTEKYRSLASASDGRKPISADWLCRCIDEAIDQDTIVVNQIISNSVSVAEQITRSRPGTMLACAGGSIQWAVGASLGAALASPRSLLVNLVTDGGFVWGSPVAALWSSLAYRANFLTVIFNNQSYGAIKRLVRGGYGAEVLPDEVAFQTGVDLMPPIEYAAVAGAMGAWGQTVTEPGDVPGALKDGLEAVRSGRPAVLDVRMQR